MLIAINIVSSYARFLLGMGAVFFLTPFILSRVGTEDFGLWSLCLALTGMLGVLDLGFSTAAVKYVAECAGSGRHEARNEALSTLLAVYTLLGLVVFTVVLAAIPAGIHFFALDNVNAERFRTIVTITGIAQGIALPLTLFRSALVGQGRYDIVNGFDVGIMAFNIILVTTLLTSGLGINGLAAANATIVLAGPIALVPVAFNKIPDLALSFRRIKLERLREAAPLAVWFMLANIALIITLRSDALLIKAFLPLTAVAAYAIAAKISESAYLLNKQFSNALMPLVSNARGAGDSATVLAILRDGTRYLAAIAAPVLALLFFHAESVVLLWVGPELRDAVLPLRILLVAVFFSTLQFNAANVLGMSGGHKGVAWTMVGSAALNIILSLALIPRLGLAGAALATLTSAAVLEFGVVLTRTCRHQSVSMVSVLRPIIPVVVSLVPMVLAAQWMQREWSVDSLVMLVGQCLVAGFVYLLSAGLMVIRRDEWRLAMNKLRDFRLARVDRPISNPVVQE